MEKKGWFETILSHFLFFYEIQTLLQAYWKSVFSLISKNPLQISICVHFFVRTVLFVSLKFPPETTNDSHKHTQQLAHLTDVAVNMEAAVQGYDPDRLLLARFGHDGLTANRAARGVLPVRETCFETSEPPPSPRWKSEAVTFWAAPRRERTCGSRLCSVSETWRPRWTARRPGSSYRPRRWSSEGGRPSPWPAGSGPEWASSI